MNSFIVSNYFVRSIDRNSLSSNSESESISRGRDHLQL